MVAYVCAQESRFWFRTLCELAFATHIHPTTLPFWYLVVFSVKHSDEDIDITMFR